MAYKRTSPMPVTEGGLGISSATAYSQLCGGTTTTGALQSATGLSTLGFVLTSTGSSSLPSYQACIGSSVAGTANDITISSTGAAEFIPFAVGSSPAINATESNVQVCIPFNCTAKNLYALIASNASTANLTLKLRQNGSDTALVVTITASTTGTFSNTTGADAVSLNAGDLIDFSISQATTGNAVGSITM